MREITKSKKTESLVGGKNSAKIVERDIQNYSQRHEENLRKFNEILAHTLITVKDLANIMETIVEAALISEFSTQIKKRNYYSRMKSTISNTLLKNKSLKKEALALARKYNQEAKVITAV